MISTTETLRHQNRAFVLAGIRELGPSAHTTLSEWSGLSSASVSAITVELEQEGVLQRVEQVASSGRGRPRVLFGPSTDFARLVMIRITTEVVEYSMIDYAGTLLDRFHDKRPEKESSTTPFLQRIVAGVERLVERSGVNNSAIQTISVTTKGVVDPLSPTLMWSPVFSDQVINFDEVFRDKFSAFVHLHNETIFSAQAIARRLRSSDKNAKQGHRIAVLSLGHSIGLGVATLRSHGRIEGFAPPFGHMVDQQRGPLCRCGASGCVEATAGFYGILRSAFGVPADTLPAPFVPLTEVDKLASKARQGERSADLAFRKAGECLGLGLARVNSLLPVSDITITGYGVHYLDLLMPGIKQGLTETMEARHGRMPRIDIESEETQLIHEGNTQWSLAQLDELRVATRLLSNIQVAG